MREQKKDSMKLGCMPNLSQKQIPQGICVPDFCFDTHWLFPFKAIPIFGEYDAASDEELGA